MASLYLRLHEYPVKHNSHNRDNRNYSSRKGRRCEIDSVGFTKKVHYRLNKGHKQHIPQRLSLKRKLHKRASVLFLYHPAGCYDNVHHKKCSQKSVCHKNRRYCYVKRKPGKKKAESKNNVSRKHGYEAFAVNVHKYLILPFH